MISDQFSILNQKLDDLTAVVLGLNSKIGKMNASANLDDDFYAEPIKSIVELQDRENHLSKFMKSPKDEEFKILRNKLVNICIHVCFCNVIFLVMIII